jgi:hypothetical protein
MTPEEQVRKMQVQHARILEATAASVRRVWLGLGSYDAADVPLFIARAQPIVERAAAQMAALVDSTTGQLAGTRPIGVASRIPDTIVNPRSTPLEDVWRRPFFDHWSRISVGKDWQASIEASASRASSIATQNTQMVMREAMAEVVTVHADEPETLRAVPQPDDTDLRTIADEQRRLAQLNRTDPTIDTTAERRRLADLRQVVLDEAPTEVRPVVGYRRVLTGKSCMFCAAAATKIYRRGDLAPLHAHCDCAVAPVFLGADVGLGLNRQVLDNLKAQGKGYWKQRGFVDNDGNPLDPTDVPDSIGRVSVNSEIGPVFAATA